MAEESGANSRRQEVATMEKGKRRKAVVRKCDCRMCEPSSEKPPHRRFFSGMDDGDHGGSVPEES
jgi:hypothetical protein